MKVKIKDICNIKSGKRIPKGMDFSDTMTEYKYIRARDIKNGKIDGTELACISLEVQEKIKRYIVETGDVVITVAGTIGEVAYVTEEYNGINLTENAVRLTGFVDYVEPKYISYVLSSKEYWEKMQQLAAGAAQPKLGIYKIEGIEIDIPSLEKQKEIMQVLSTYDCLIKNYEKQVKLLYEMANRIFKEWFLFYRFPKCNTIGERPQEWNITNLNEIVTFHRGYDLTQTRFVEGGYPVVGSTSILGYHNEYKIEGPGIITGRSGSLGKYQLVWENYWPHNTALYISDFKEHELLYVYGLLQTIDLTGLNNGGAVPTLNRNTLSNIIVLEPTKELQEKYARLVTPFYKKIRVLERQIDLAKNVKNMLLPKLIGGC